METSCFTNSNVANAFETLIEITNIDKKKNQPKIEDNNKINLNDMKNKKNNGKKSCSC